LQQKFQFIFAGGGRPRPGPGLGLEGKKYFYNLLSIRFEGCESGCMKEKTKPVRIPESLHLRVKTFASSQGQSMQQWLMGLIERALPPKTKSR
jgi:hypothetical protein